MRRVLLWTLLGGLALFASLTTIVLVRADSPGLPAPDPAMPIHLADGSTRPLSEVVDAAREGRPLPVKPPDVAVRPDPSWTPEQAAEYERVLREIAADLQRDRHGADGTLFRLAEDACDEGRLDEAAALYLSVPRNDPEYARARRRLGWDVLSVGQRQPRLAVGYVNQSVRAHPLDGDCWEDLVRVYAATLGLDTSGWN